MNGPRFELFNVPDVRQMCRGAAWGYCQKKNLRLQPADMDGLVAFLEAAVWRMSERYDPEINSNFEAYVRGRLANRCVDWVRGEYSRRTRWQFGERTHERELPRFVSLDAAARDDGETLEESLRAVDGDPEAGADPDSFGGLLGERDREAAWDTAVVHSLAGRLLQGRNRAA